MGYRSNIALAIKAEKIKYFLSTVALQPACRDLFEPRNVKIFTEFKDPDDENGILFPSSVSPFQVYLAPINMDKPEVLSVSESIHKDLIELGIDVLIDDRNESPGVKLNDADLLGFPVRLVVSPRTLKDQSVEVKFRTNLESDKIPLIKLKEKMSEIFLKDS